ncbi:MAG: hypothetical protein M3N57_09995 [Actinomycetota bacterium]|nr:hypothetical protein [Actinomycetota bacterium]
MILSATLMLPTGPLDLEVAAGEAAVLDGPAAGAAIAALAGTDGRRDHRIHVGGRDLGRLPTHARVRRGLGLVIDAAVAGDVSVRDHLAAVVGGRRADAMLDCAPLLAGRGNDPAGVLSGGERRMLAWLRCLATDPEAVVLDRAGAGLDLPTGDWAAATVRRWRQAGVAVIVRPATPRERRWVEPTDATETRTVEEP